MVLIFVSRRYKELNNPDIAHATKGLDELEEYTTQKLISAGTYQPDGKPVSDRDSIRERRSAFDALLSRLPKKSDAGSTPSN